MPPTNNRQVVRRNTVGMRIADVARLFDYLYWIRDRVLTAAAGLSDDDFRSTETVATRDLRSTLVHELDVESSWRQRLAGVDPAAEESELDPLDYPTVAALTAAWSRDESAMRMWIGSLTEAELAAPPPHERATLPLADYLMHIVGHGIEEFTEAALLLTRAGHSPGDIEFLEFVDPRV